MSFSTPTTSKPCPTRCRTDSEPISPPDPVTIAILDICSRILGSALTVIATAEVGLQPYVQHDEEVAAAHLAHRQLALARHAVAPGDRDHGETVAAHDCLQRDLDREVEMVR